MAPVPPRPSDGGAGPAPAAPPTMPEVGFSAVQMFLGGAARGLHRQPTARADHRQHLPVAVENFAGRAGSLGFDQTVEQRGNPSGRHQRWSPLLRPGAALLPRPLAPCTSPPARLISRDLELGFGSSLRRLGEEDWRIVDLRSWGRPRNSQAMVQQPARTSRRDLPAASACAGSRSDCRQGDFRKGGSPDSVLPRLAPGQQPPAGPRILQPEATPMPRIASAAARGRCLAVVTLGCGAQRRFTPSSFSENGVKRVSVS